MVGNLAALVPLLSGVIRRSPAANLPAIRIHRRHIPPAPEQAIAAVHSRDLVADLAGWSLVVHGKGNRERTILGP